MGEELQLANELIGMVPLIYAHEDTSYRISTHGQYVYDSAIVTKVVTYATKLRLKDFKRTLYPAEQISPAFCNLVDLWLLPRARYLVRAM